MKRCEIPWDIAQDSFTLEGIIKTTSFSPHIKERLLEAKFNMNRIYTFGRNMDGNMIFFQEND